MLNDCNLPHQATLMIAAAGALINTVDHPAPQLFCLASIICNLGSAMASTTLLCCFEHVDAVRIAWYNGGGLFVLALSAPSGWLRWGIVTLLGALLAILWMSQPVAANVVGCVLVTVQLMLFFHQQVFLRGGIQLVTGVRPLAPQAAERIPGVARTAKSEEDCV